MKARTMVLSVTLLIVLLTGCKITQGPGAAERLVSEYFDAIKAKDLDKAMNFYSDDFFKASTSKITEKEWRELLPRVQDKLGDLQTYRLISWKINEHVGTGKPGTYYAMRYDVTYAKGSATEDVTIFNPTNGSDKDLRILGHNINSPGLLK